jgi:hypothetical protein
VEDPATATKMDELRKAGYANEPIRRQERHGSTCKRNSTPYRRRAGMQARATKRESGWMSPSIRRSSKETAKARRGRCRRSQKARGGQPAFATLHTSTKEGNSLFRVAMGVLSESTVRVKGRTHPQKTLTSSPSDADAGQIKYGNKRSFLDSIHSNSKLPSALRWSI